jgi:hypothetical protein
MYELGLGFQTKQEKKTKTSQQKKIFYNLNPDVNKKKNVDADDKKNISNKKKNVSLRYVMAKKHVTKKILRSHPRPPQQKKNVMLCCIYEVFRNRNVMGLNVNAYNTKTTPSTHS